MRSLGSLAIADAQSRDFARVSGDFNPLHLDPVAARRTRFGHTLIHGVHGTLKALDLLLDSRAVASALAGITVKYTRPVTQGQRLECFEQSLEDAVIRLELFADGSRCQIIDLTFVQGLAGCASPDIAFRQAWKESCDPVERPMASAKALAGSVALSWDAALMSALLPNATRYLPAHQLAVLMASSRIVGMECPGLHSVFAQLDIRFSDADTNASPEPVSQLEYRVRSIDPRIDRVELALQHATASGSLEAFFRPPPVQQASFKRVASMVEASEFCQQSALVVGASRGLGEVIAKLLAAGGARVMMTYAAGREDAERVSTEIGRERSPPDVCAYNVLDGVMPPGMAAFCATATHVYYLASPTISKRGGKQWDAQLFSRYSDFYVHGLATLLQQVLPDRSDNKTLQIFMPSTIFLEQYRKGFDEYIAAKSAAEAFARCMEKSHPECTVLAPRLPALLTDQTSSSKNGSDQRTVEVMLEQLRFVAASVDSGCMVG